MPDTKITALTAIGANPIIPATFPIPMVDLTDTSMAASGTTKKVTVNQILGAGGTATLASATITGDLTARNWFVTGGSLPGVGNGNPFAYRIGGGGLGIGAATETGTTAPIVFYAGQGGIEQYRIAPLGVNTWSDGAGGTRMTLNATGLGVGQSPTAPLHIYSAATGTGPITNVVGTFRTGAAGRDVSLQFSDTANQAYVTMLSGALLFGTGGATERVRIDTVGNVGIGVAPSAWTTTFGLKASQVYNSALASNGTSGFLTNNAYYAGAGYTPTYINASSTPAQGILFNSTGANDIRFVIGAAGTAGNTIAGFSTAAMTLDASGNLLVGTTSGSNSRVVQAVAAGTTVFEVTGAAGYGSFFQSGDAQGSSSALSIANIGKVVSTGRSINAGGTINASGADYAEYMTKASDFVLSKGGIAGIDSNGKLTNVFADAVSFVVKSTDPSYVGNDKWGTGIEGDALEAARQLVDRIAFAGQVPVNVTGAQAGDYIVPVVDGTGIKGIAVSKPTFEQYQLAVGKVIAIDADGRARIIVKVA